MIMKSNMKVRMELELEALAGHLNASDREVLARKFYRWAKQLYVSSHILRQHSGRAPLPQPCSRRGSSSLWSPNRVVEPPDTGPSWPGQVD